MRLLQLPFQGRCLALLLAVLAIACMGCKVGSNAAVYNSLTPDKENTSHLWLGDVDSMRQDMLLVLEHHYLEPIEEQGLHFLIEGKDFTVEAELEPRETPGPDGGLITAYAARMSINSKKREHRRKLAELQADLESAFGQKYTLHTIARIAPVEEQPAVEPAQPEDVPEAQPAEAEVL